MVKGLYSVSLLILCFTVSQLYSETVFCIKKALIRELLYAIFYKMIYNILFLNNNEQ